MPDPWVMYYVVRKDHPLSLAGAMALAGGAAVRCVDRFATNERWAAAFRAWRERPRKVALRAGEDEVEAVRRELDCVDVRTGAGVTLVCLPPRLRSESEPLLRELRPYTDGPRPREAASGVVDGPSLVYVIRPGVIRTAGKAIAQAGHAALACWDELGERYSESFAAWRAAGTPGEVRTADRDIWERLKTEVDCVVVADSGLTQVEPGTETVIALPPADRLPEPLGSLPRQD